jgi:glycosyltransferase involved in cell wall biosynthesis
MKDQMKLLFISIDHNLETIDSAVWIRMAHYGRLVERLDILLVNSKTDSERKISDNVILHTISGGKWSSTWKAIWMSKRLADKDTVLSAQDPFELGLIGWLATLISKSRLHVQVHIDFFSSYFKSESLRQRIQSVIAPFVLRKAKSIRVVSGKIASYLAIDLGIKAPNIVIAPIYVDIESLRQREITIDLHKQYPEFEWIVLVAARLVKQKNIPLALEAFQIFHEVHPKTGIVIAGSGSEKSAIEKLIIEKKMDFARLGDWRGEFSSLMRTSDAFVLSSNYEGWAMTVIEAAALGKPIVMTEVGCAHEFIVPEKNGLIVPVGNKEALATALLKYYDNRAFAKNMSLAAERDALTYMSHEENDALLLKSWQNALESSEQ